MARKKTEYLWQMFLARLSSPIMTEEGAAKMMEAVQGLLAILTDAEVAEEYEGFSVEGDPEQAKALALMEAAGLHPVRIIKTDAGSSDSS